jgi:hypothetical protein
MHREDPGLERVEYAISDTRQIDHEDTSHEVTSSPHRSLPPRSHADKLTSDIVDRARHVATRYTGLTVHATVILGRRSKLFLGRRDLSQVRARSDQASAEWATPTAAIECV